MVRSEAKLSMCQVFSGRQGSRWNNVATISRCLANSKDSLLVIWSSGNLYLLCVWAGRKHMAASETLNRARESKTKHAEVTRRDWVQGGGLGAYSWLGKRIATSWDQREKCVMETFIGEQRGGEVRAIHTGERLRYLWNATFIPWEEKEDG